jgi:hypothetical protein
METKKLAHFHSLSHSPLTPLSLVHLSTLSHQEQEGAKKRGREKELEITTSKIMEIK